MEASHTQPTPAPAPRPSLVDRIARVVLLGPDVVSRAAAAGRGDKPEEAWMLRQSREVRESFVREVVDRGGHPVRAQVWMLRQDDDVRESYVREVLEPALHEPPAPGDSL